VVVLVANLVSEPEETHELDAAAHLRLIEQHAGGSFLDAVLVHQGAIESRLLERYEAEDSHPLPWPDVVESSVGVHRRDLVGPGPKIRHDPLATSEALIEVWQAERATRFSRHTG
jgi:2-phospho-L-lactate transferase/gluconeogenesis factor (CofD/UPF0052 family)